MKTIENKTTSITKSEGVNAKYSDLFVALLNKPISKNMDLKSMRRDIKLLDLMEANTDTIEVTSEEFDHLASLVDTSEWAFRHQDILSFADYIDSLKSKKGTE